MDRNNQLPKKREIAPDFTDATILVNRFGIISYVNEQAQEQFGYRVNELQGKSLKELLPEITLHETEEGKVVHQYGQHRNGQVFSIFYRINSFKQEKKQKPII